MKQKNISLSYGGPVANDTIFYMHSKGKSVPQSEYIGKGLYWGGDFSVVKDQLATGEISPDEIRFFLGYSGWSATQLEDEINKDSWIVADIATKTIMNRNHTDLWRESLKSLGGKYSLWAEFPDDPLLN
ncbi:MAG: YqgE/AlgH family protein [Bacteroidales bacterium]|nr:YqgE/AlgH family protein [Bacteroidales bacterium]